MPDPDQRFLEALWIVVYSAIRAGMHGATPLYTNDLPTDDNQLLKANMQNAVNLAVKRLDNK